MMTPILKGDNASPSDDMTRRDFIDVSAAAFTATGAALAFWPLIDSLSPAADVRALTEIEVQLGPIDIGQRITVKWQGRPVFIIRRSPAVIAKARADDNNPNLIDPALDSARIQRPEWLIVVGICTHLGCVPLGQRAHDPKGRYDGWFCPCHGSVYDLSGRVRRGPAPRNLIVPPYVFLDDNVVRIG